MSWWKHLHRYQLHCLHRRYHSIWVSELRYYWTDLDIIFDVIWLAIVLSESTITAEIGSISLKQILNFCICWIWSCHNLNIFIAFLFELWLNADHCKSNHFQVGVITRFLNFLNLGIIYFTHLYLQLFGTFSVSLEVQAFWLSPLEMLPVNLFSNVSFD